MAYYDYFKNIKPTYALPPYGGVQGGRQAQALGAGRYKPYSEMVRAQAERLPTYYALAQQREWQKGLGEQQQEMIDIEQAGLKQDIIEAENLRWQRERELDIQEEQARRARQLGYAQLGLAGAGLAGQAIGWGKIGAAATTGGKYALGAIPYLAPAAIAATWAYGLKEATKGRSYGQTARAIAERGVGADYTPAVEAVNLKLIKDYGMNKSAYDRVTMGEIDKLIMQYGGDKENLAMLYNSISNLLSERIQPTAPSGGLGRTGDTISQWLDRPYVDIRQLAQNLPPEQITEILSFLEEKYPYADPETLIGRMPEPGLDRLREERQKHYTYINPADLRGLVSDELVTQLTVGTEPAIDPRDVEKVEAMTGAITDIVEQSFAVPSGEKPPTHQAPEGTRYTGDVILPSGAHQTGYYQTSGVEQLLREVYGEPAEDEEELIDDVSKMALSRGIPEEEDLESIRQKIAIGRL